MARIQRGFTHIRANRGLAGQVGRITGRQMRHNYDSKLNKSAKKLSKAIDERNADKVKKTLEGKQWWSAGYLKQFDKQEHWTKLVFFDELRIVNESELDGKKEKDIVKKLHKELKKYKSLREKKDAKNIKEITAEFDELKKDLVAIAENVRRITESLLKKEYKTAEVEMASSGALMTQSTAEWMKTLNEKFKASSQKRSLRKEKKVDHMLDILSEIDRDLKGNKLKDTERELERLSKGEKKIFKAIEKNIHAALTIILRDLVLYMHILKHFDNLKKAYGYLKGKDFSPDFLRDTFSPWIQKHEKNFEKSHDQLHAMVTELERQAQEIAA